MIEKVTVEKRLGRKKDRQVEIVKSEWRHQVRR